jgi:hypothetical protein
MFASTTTKRKKTFYLALLTVLTITRFEKFTKG